MIIICYSLLTEVNALINILVKDGDQKGYGCVGPRCSYTLKGGFPRNVFTD